MRKRRITHGGAENLKKYETKELACACGIICEVDEEATTVKCWKCTQIACPVDPKYLIQKSQIAKTVVETETGEKVTISNSKKRPRGWHLGKEFVDSDGTVYHFGKEVPELKGTLPITDVEAIKVAQKVKSNDRKANKAARQAKKEAKLLKQLEKKKKQQEREERRKTRELKKRASEGE